jgi:hypothetical protein
MLVVDTDRAQARALALLPAGRQIVRAPNPIYPLSIPSAPFPNAVAAYTAGDGSETLPFTALPFAFILSTAASQVTVVGGASDKTGFLARLGEFQVPDTTLAIAVQPCTNTDTDIKHCSSETTHLILAVRQSSGVALYTASFESTFDPAGLGSVTLRRIVELGPNSLPVALAFSPSPSGRNVLAVADQNTGDDGLGRQGSLAVVELDGHLSAGTVARYDVGGPLKVITIEAAGRRLFGVVDAPLCGTTIPCSTLMGFDLALRQKVSAPAVEVSGSARGIAASEFDTSKDRPKAVAVTVEGASVPTSVSPLVAVTSTDGAVKFYDGESMSSLLTVPITSTSLILTMPGSIAWVPDPQLKSFYAAYQGGSALVELNAENVRNANSTAGLKMFR